LEGLGYHFELFSGIARWSVPLGIFHFLSYFVGVKGVKEVIARFARWGDKGQ
jgi:hypothetical protein